MIRLLIGVVAAGVIGAGTYFTNSRGSSNTITEGYASESAREDNWVDSVYNSMTDEQRLGQLFMVAAYPQRDAAHETNLKNIIQQYNIGGLIFFKGNPTKIAQLSNKYQAAARTPLMMAIDGEWGISMRVDSTVRYPYQLMLGAIKDNTLIYEFGTRVAQECKRIGLHINFAPVADVNNNINNPVINYRSFGENRQNVTAKCFQYMMGMQDNNIMACAKHFPGHGDTDVDSHQDLPVIRVDRTRLDSLELYPFRNLIQHNVQSAMIAHLSVPALDDTPNLPTTLSKKVVTDLLKKELGFRGLVFTDAIDMKGVTKFFPNGLADAKALVAGIDVVLMPQDLPAAYTEIKAAIERGEITWAELNARERKVLHAKFKLGLNRYRPVKTLNIYNDLNSPAAKALREKLIVNALTLVKNNDGLVPFKRTDTLDLANIAIGVGSRTTFQTACANFAPSKEFYVQLDIPAAKAKGIVDQVRKKDAVIVSLNNLSQKAAKNYNITPATQAFIADLAKVTRVILVDFGNPYALRNFPNINNVVVCYDDDTFIQRATAQALFGAAPFKGIMPVTALPEYSFGMGVETANFRMPYALPADVGMSETILNQIDGIAEMCIKQKAAPGCAVLVAREGKIVFQRSYGTHTYDAAADSTLPSDVFDMASVTKIASTTMAVMHLYDEGKLDLDAHLGDYLPELKNTNKNDLVIRDVLTHQAGLISWIPFYTSTLDKTKHPDKKLYSNQPSAEFSIKVSDHLYMKTSYRDTIYQRIFDSKLRTKRDYEYSDLGLILTKLVVERISGKPLDVYMNEVFYEPMGLYNTGYNPLTHIPLARCVPTEEDNYFRYETIQGYVHDMGAAQLGGVSGHAGLFTTVNELATLEQMLMNGGTFNGVQYLNPATILEFTSYRNSAFSRRGVGFDKPDVRGGVNVSSACSEATFGHTGFTGICVWTDPAKQLIYVFCSNRTYPDMNNKKLQHLDIRTKIQDIVYAAIL